MWPSKSISWHDTMLRLFLERIFPPRPHGEPINIELPMDITNKELLLTMGEKVLLAVANPGITPSQGKAIFRAR